MASARSWFWNFGFSCCIICIIGKLPAVAIDKGIIDAGNIVGAAAEEVLAGDVQSPLPAAVGIGIE